MLLLSLCICYVMYGFMAMYIRPFAVVNLHIVDGIRAILRVGFATSDGDISYGTGGGSNDGSCCDGWIVVLVIVDHGNDGGSTCGSNGGDSSSYGTGGGSGNSTSCGTSSGCDGGTYGGSNSAWQLYTTIFSTTIHHYYTMYSGANYGSQCWCYWCEPW